MSGFRTSSARIYLSKPIITSLTAGKGQITVKWDMAVVGASTYDIYYQAVPGGTWKKVTAP